MRRALVIGIDDYPGMPLSGCVNDANSVARLLERNGDGSPNFSVRLLTSDNYRVDAATLNQAVALLFAAEADTAVFYFAGHGIINPDTNAGYIVAENGQRGAWGMSLSELLDLAHQARSKIKSTVIILDSCHSGFVGEVAGMATQNISAIGNGLTILTACHREGAAAEVSGGGLFTQILVDGLEGAASDICGRVTPAALYAHVDQTMGPWEQRPIYKANVQTFITLREVSPKIPMEILRRLPTYFPDPAYQFPLDPSYEPDRLNIPEHLRHLPVNEDHARVFKELQICNRHGLVQPVDAEHMYYAAINSTACRLTAMGAHYRKLAEIGRL